MRIHHLNAATLCPVGHSLVLAHGDDHLVCHCLLLETDTGLVLVDTALGLDDLQAASHQGVRDNMRTMGPRWDPEQTVARQVERLGFKREDVRHIVLTHLDLDHAGGLPDFPHARVHLSATEHAAARDKRAFRERKRYQDVQWAHGPDWRLYDAAQGERWFGFDGVRALDGLPPEILLVPLTGHTRGHCGVAVNHGNGWLLHAGDAYFFRGEMEEPAHCPLGLRLLQDVLAMKGQERRDNRDRLHELARTQQGQVRVFCAHDAEEWRRLAGTTSS
jgi:glyoxylase-like metal-dependent hydrolase (beta-lactamase superfamily II)